MSDRADRRSPWRMCTSEVDEQATRRTILLCRMVRDNLKRAIVHSEKQSHAAETPSQSQEGEEATGGEQRAQSPDRAKPESPEFLLWYKLPFQEPETWDQVSASIEVQTVNFIFANSSVLLL